MVVAHGSSSNVLVWSLTIVMDFPVGRYLFSTVALHMITQEHKEKLVKNKSDPNGSLFSFFYMIHALADYRADMVIAVLNAIRALNVKNL